MVIFNSMTVAPSVYDDIWKRLEKTRKTVTNESVYTFSVNDNYEDVKKRIHDLYSLMATDKASKWKGVLNADKYIFERDNIGMVGLILGNPHYCCELHVSEIDRGTKIDLVTRMYSASRIFISVSYYAGILVPCILILLLLRKQFVEYGEWFGTVASIGKIIGWVILWNVSIYAVTSFWRYVNGEFPVNMLLDIINNTPVTSE